MVYNTRWRNSRQRTLLENIAYPLAYALNRPRLQWVGRLLYDFALRCNGIGIAFPGKVGLTVPEENFLRRIASRLQGGTVLDVGANQGSYSALIKALVPDARVFAFEPHPKNFSFLKASAQEKGFTAIPLAVSDNSGLVHLYDFSDNDGSTQASLGENTITFQEGSDAVRYDVQSITLDEFCLSNHISNISLLKIDTEGFDLSVVRGSKQILSDNMVDIVQFEVIPADIVQKIVVKDFFDALPNYNLFRICLNGHLLPLTTYSVKECEIYVPHNIIALRKGIQSIYNI